MWAIRKPPFLTSPNRTWEQTQAEVRLRLCNRLMIKVSLPSVERVTHQETQRTRELTLTTQRTSVGRRNTGKDYRRFWDDITSTSEESKAVRTPADILSDNKGRSLVSGLERKDAELCVEILGRVSPNPYPVPSFLVSHVANSCTGLTRRRKDLQWGHSPGFWRRPLGTWPF